MIIVQEFTPSPSPCPSPSQVVAIFPIFWRTLTTSSVVTFPVTVTLFSCASTLYVSISARGKKKRTNIVLANHKNGFNGSLRYNLELPSIFLMAFKIFLMHSSQCKPTFNSTTWCMQPNMGNFQSISSNKEKIELEVCNKRGWSLHFPFSFDGLSKKVRIVKWEERECCLLFT